jgi:hypothetical protein
MARVVEYRALMGSLAVLLRADSFCLVAASTIGFLLDSLGVPVAGIGFADAHELALIAGALLWRAAPRPCWLLSAAAVHAFFAIANLAHWQTFTSADIVAAGWLTTGAHLLFAALGFVAVRTAGSGPVTARPTQPGTTGFGARAIAAADFD